MVSRIRPLSMRSSETTRPVICVEISEPNICVPARHVSTLAASSPRAHKSAAMKHRWVFGHERETSAQIPVRMTTATGLAKSGSAVSEK